jgi:phage host-nuclease inhibitor protein Gam
MEKKAALVKTKYANDIRRFSLSRGEASAYPSLLEALGRVYPGQQLVLKYIDDEGDEVRVDTAEEFDEGLRVAAHMAPPVLRLNLYSATASGPPPPPPSPSPLVAPSVLVAQLDAIQEAIVANLSQIQSLAPHPPAQAAQAPQAAQAVQAPQAVAVSAAPVGSVSQVCSAASRDIIERCACISRELPRYTQAISDEVAAECKRVAEEMAARCRTVSSQMVSTEAYSRATSDLTSSCSALHRQVHDRCESLAAEVKQQALSDAAATTASSAHAAQPEEVRVRGKIIEDKCKALAQETTKRCEDLSHDIVSLVMHI